MTDVTADGKTRHVILHYHIFKNAGSSVDADLRNSFGPTWHSFDRDARWTNITTVDLSSYLEEHPDVRALSSHQARWPEPSSEKLRVHPVVFIRHPIDRIGSIYSHARRTGEASAQNLSFPEYVDWLMAADGGIVAKSFQTLFLSDDDHLTQLPEASNTICSDAHFDSAKRRLQALPVFGIVERFSASSQLFFEHMAVHFPDLSMTAPRENASPDRGVLLGDRLDGLLNLMGARRYARVASINEADMDLWDFAVQLFGERLKSSGRQDRSLHRLRLASSSYSLVRRCSTGTIPTPRLRKQTWTAVD